MSRQTHRSDSRILNRRTLERDHRHLSELLIPGMSVLDIGCGPGAITSGIARKVGPQGNVLGVDRDETLLSEAKQEYAAVPNLHFEQHDVLSLPFESRFDIVTAARTLQWVSDAAEAVVQMKKAAAPNGRIVILDYNHAENSWNPDPPPEFRRYYQAFLDWREANRWDNHMADHLPHHFQAAGLANVHSVDSGEIVTRGDADFAGASAIWSQVIQTIGPRLIAAGFLTDQEFKDAGDRYGPWIQNELQQQTHSMSTVVGTVVNQAG